MTTKTQGIEDRSLDICECGHERTEHYPYSINKPCKFATTISKMNECHCYKFQPKKEGEK